MKIRHPLAVKVLGFAVACLIRVWIGTVRFRHRPARPNRMPTARGLHGRYLYTFWHENLIMPAYQYGRGDVHVLVSKHADGELISQACQRLGFRLVRGSSTRDFFAAVRGMLHRGRTGHLAVTPDGPRGPRRKVQPGLVWLAARTGLPIVPMSFAYRRAWRMRSWDRFVLPCPWSDVVMVTTAPIHVPEDVRKAQLEAYCLRVEEALRRAELTAERLVGRAGRPKENAPAREAA